jgi:DNA-binding XRE family transcriptional regulator
MRNKLIINKPVCLPTIGSILISKTRKSSVFGLIPLSCKIAFIHFIHRYKEAIYWHLTFNFILRKILMNVDAQLQAVAANIKQRRTSLRLSQMYMAARLNVTQNAYSKMEMAKTKLSVQRLYEIAEILNIQPGQLCIPM